MISSQLVILACAGTAFFILVGFIITFLIIRHNNNLNNVNNEKNKLLNESRIRHIEENERMINQISRELHDNIGQSANLIIASLHKMESNELNAQMVTLINNAKDLSRQLLQDAQNISHSLNQNYIKTRSLHALLQQNLEHLRHFKSIQSEFIIEGAVQTLAPDSKLLVYRIAQEVFQNILKHANATEVLVHLSYGPNTFCMLIEDNGIGLVKETIQSRDGIGFTNMYERAEVLGGLLTIESRSPAGCCITLSMPDVKYIQDRTSSQILDYNAD